MHHLPPLPVRFFGPHEETGEIEEVGEADFLMLVDQGCIITYCRHTVRENGVSQICLTAVGGGEW